MDVTAHTAPSQQAVSLPLQGMEVWMNRHQIEELGFSFQQEHDKSIPFTKTYGSPEERLPLQHLVIFEKIITNPLLECFCRFRKFHGGSGRE